jgi:hypothetical protein
MFEQGPPEPTLIDALRDFLPIAVGHLNLDHIPKIKLAKEMHDTHVPTFGRFENESKIITVVIDNRNIVDTLRTLAHEMVHYAQGEEHRLDAESGETGSPIEDEANAEGGVIMRLFNQAHPNYMQADPIVLPEAWSNKYKRSINCNNPKGFSQKAHCQGRKKSNEAVASTKFDANQALDQIASSIDLVLQQQQTTPTLDVTKVLKLIKDAIYESGQKTETPPGKYFALLYQQVQRVAKTVPTAGSRNIGTAGMEARHALAGIRRDTIPTIQQLLTQSVKENFADGKKPGRKGLAKRSGVNCKQSVTALRKIAKNSSGERQRMAHWCANMKSGRNK